jgi:hypothetical protein
MDDKRMMRHSARIAKNGRCRRFRNHGFIRLLSSLRAWRSLAVISSFFQPIVAWVLKRAIWGGVPIVKVSEVVGSEQLVTKILIFDCTDKKSAIDGIEPLISRMNTDEGGEVTNDRPASLRQPASLREALPAGEARRAGE